MPSPTAAHNACIRFKSRHKRVALALALLPCAFAHAESADLFNLSIEELMDVKVSVASLTEESMLDAPATVAKLTREEWDENGSRRLGDALESVPSVVSYEFWGGAEAIAIRGYATELSVRGIASSLNGVPLNTFTHATSAYHLTNVSLDMLNQVEMIRGPGSTLYGTDAFHGVMAMQTRASDEDIEEASATLGSPGYSEGSYFISSHDESRALNAGFSYERQGEQNIPYQYTAHEDGSQQKSERDNLFRNISGFITLHWGERSTLGQWQFTGFANDYEARDYSGVGTQFFYRIPEAFAAQSASLSADEDTTDQTSRIVMGQLQHSLDLNDDFSLKSNLYHWRSDYAWVYNNDSYPESLTRLSNSVTYDCRNATTSPVVNPVYCPHKLIQDYEESRTGIQTVMHAKGVLPDTSLVSGLGWDHQKIFGANIERKTNQDVYLFKGPQDYSNKSREILYAFAQGRTTWYENQLALNYGVRYDQYSDENAHTSPRLGLIWHIDDEWTSKWLYGHAFRAPNASENSVTSLASSSLSSTADIKPETIDSLEWVNIWHKQNFQHEMVLFANRWKDSIILVPITTGSTINTYINSGDSEALGIELSSRYQQDAMKLGGSLSYIESTNTDTDQDYVAFPNWGITLQAGYLFAEPGIELTLKQRMLLDYADYDQIGRSDYPRTNQYLRTDMSLSKQVHSTNGQNAPELFAHFYNLFDRDNVIPGIYNTENGIPDDGFHFALGARWKW